MTVVAGPEGMGGASSRLGYLDAASTKSLLMVGTSSVESFMRSAVSLTALTELGASRPANKSQE